MGQALGPIGDLLTRQPAGGSQPGSNAGPSFVLRTVHALPHKTAAWHLLCERFEELAGYTDELASQTGEAALARAAKALWGVRASLTQI
ncbi:MAG: hypothetical protein GEU75_09430 [Dehalococcoidia bacterium]|nr:hypothetical protein [Dehalococcoidia bacterium]